MANINNKQRRFIDEYLIDLNATKAAIRAGYSAKSARQIGQRMLSFVDIKNAINAELIEIHETHKKTLMVASSKAIEALVDTLEHGGWGAKVSAANSILDRSGHKASDFLVSELKAEIKYNNENTADAVIARLLGLSAEEMSILRSEEKNTAEHHK